MRDLESPTSFGGVKIAQNSTALQGIHAKVGEIQKQWVEFGLAGDSGYVAYLFIAVVIILILASCFISNYRVQASLIPTTHRYPVSRSTPSPFAKFPRTTHHNATRCLRSHSLTLIALHDPLSFYHSEVVVAVPRRVGIPYPGTSTRMIPVPDPLTSMLLG